MQEFAFRKGLNLPVRGAPAQEIGQGPHIRTVALLGADYRGLKPRLAVEEGDAVGAGTPIFAHKDIPQVMMTAPVSGRVKAINRGARRALISVEIEVEPDLVAPVDFSEVGDASTADGLAERLCASGLWNGFLTRPYSKVPDPETRPAAIYVTAIDSEPLAADPALIIAEAGDAFVKGLSAITLLTEGNTYLCVESGAAIPGGDVAGVTAASFSGPHPAGLPGTHMHFLEPPTSEKIMWTIGYQDVIAIGQMLETGHVNSERVIALGLPYLLVLGLAEAGVWDLQQVLERSMGWDLLLGASVVAIALIRVLAKRPTSEPAAP